MPRCLARDKPGLHIVEQRHAVEIFGQLTLYLKEGFDLGEDAQALVQANAPVEYTEEREWINLLQ